MAVSSPERLKLPRSGCADTATAAIESALDQFLTHFCINRIKIIIIKLNKQTKNDESMTNNCLGHLNLCNMEGMASLTCSGFRLPHPSPPPPPQKRKKRIGIKE